LLSRDAMVARTRKPTPPSPLQAHLAREAELEANDGVMYDAVLKATALDPAVAAGKGIRRAVDKLSLPAAAGAALLDAGARRHGAPIFRVEAVDGEASVEPSTDPDAPSFPPMTHAGVLDYNAPPGTVAVPPHVAARLWPGWGGGVPPRARARARYSRAPKGASAVLQPVKAGFHAAAGEQVKEVLEVALGGLCALTVGDAVAVATPDGALHALRVKALTPADAVTVIETDLEVELEESAETAARLAREAAAAAAAAARVRAAGEARKAAAAAAAAAPAPAPAPRPSAARPLPAEPASDAPSVALRVRAPDGAAFSRRFPPDIPLTDVRMWAAAAWGGGGDFELAPAGPGGARLPRGGTLESAGVASGTALLLLPAVVEKGGGG